ncbi:MAG: hypothetical protein ABGY75_02690 [Gemmataceae bacterium]
MTRVVTKSRVGADGVLHLELPLGTPEAGREVQVTVESVMSPTMTQAEWVAFLDRTAGAWQGEFERPPQGEYETREALS